MSQVEEVVKQAIQNTENWPTKGWATDFGPQRVPVNNLDEARKLNNKFSFRLEAIAYWERVKLSSEEAATWGRKTLEALKKGDIKDAKDCAYYAMIVEKPLNEKAPVWSSVYKALN